MLIVALMGAPVPLGLMVWFLFAAPSFVAMFADFGAVLPAATVLVLQPWWGPLMIAAYLLALPVPFFFRTTDSRDFAMVGVVVLALMGVMSSAACLYLPLVQMSVQVR